MKVLYVITGISRKAGGPSRSSQGLVAALCRAGVDAWIYPFDGAEPWIPGVRKIPLKQSNNLNNRTILQDMGRCGHELVEERYTWAAVCDKMVRGYEDVLK